ncbi:uncharacterized protein V1518DRAFT_407373 [Limtongia smithiae]|uniref:uncharacterized protein n=1 Tax=Limtongia smithiae TaxID=1125753 RepID=UPI0034CDC776
MTSFQHLFDGDWPSWWSPSKSSIALEPSPESMSSASGLNPSSSGAAMQPQSTGTMARAADSSKWPSKGSPKRPAKPLKSHATSTNDRDSDESTERSQPKRSKMALSCSECKRRKVKCDRNVPCMACIKRGAGDSCNWDDAKIDPSPQPFALSSELAEVQDRLLSIESFLQTLPSALRAGWSKSRTADAASALATAASDAAAAKLQQHQRSAVDDGIQASAPSNNAADSSASAASDEGYDDAAEDAAVVLESVAFNPSSNESGSGPRSIISHEYWRGSIVRPSSEGQLGSSEAEVDELKECTSALTSIKAPRWDPSLDLHNPLVMCQDLDSANLPQVYKNRVDILSALLGSLPTVRQSYYLAAQYHDKVDWRHHILHWPSFCAELDRFWEMIARGRHAEVDPLWLAVFFMVMALALDCRPAGPMEPSHPFHVYTNSELDELTSKYHAVSVRALYMGDCMGTPRVRMIQTVLLFNQYFQTSTSGKKAGMMLNWIALAIRTAQLMGLHTLGSDSEIMPPDDPAWPPGKNAIKRHMALRIWMQLQWADWISASGRFRSYVIHPDQCTSQLVDNVNDWELSPTDWHYTPYDVNVITSTSLEVYKWNIANMLRRTYDKLITHAKDFSYSTVLELDKGYRNILDNLPEPFKGESNSAEPEDEKLKWQRNVALEGIHSRIVRLHRPFLSRGYSKESKFAYSREQCLKSARIIVDCHYNLRDLTTTGVFWFAYSHTLGASIVLLHDLFWSIDNDVPPPELAEKMRVITMVQDIFSMYNEISNSSLRKIVESSYRIIRLTCDASGLASEGESRHSARAARRFSLNGDSKLAKPESFAEVLRRISHNPGVAPVQNIASSSMEYQSSSSQPITHHALQYIQTAGLPGSLNQTPQTSAFQRPQDLLSSGLYSALGVSNEEVFSDSSFTSLWNLNLSPVSQAGSTGDSQADLSFLGSSNNSRIDEAAANYLLQQIIPGFGGSF